MVCVSLIFLCPCLPYCCLDDTLSSNFSIAIVTKSDCIEKPVLVSSFVFQVWRRKEKAGHRHPSCSILFSQQRLSFPCSTVCYQTDVVSLSQNGKWNVFYFMKLLHSNRTFILGEWTGC